MLSDFFSFEERKRGDILMFFLGFWTGLGGLRAISKLVPVRSFLKSLSWRQSEPAFFFRFDNFFVGSVTRANETQKLDDC